MLRISRRGERLRRTEARAIFLGVVLVLLTSPSRCDDASAFIRPRIVFNSFGSRQEVTHPTQGRSGGENGGSSNAKIARHRVLAVASGAAATATEKPSGFMTLTGESGRNTRSPTKRTRAGAVLRATSVLLHDEPTYFGGRQPVTSRVAQWLITRFILARARASSGLDVMVEARSNREAVKGRFDAVTVQFDELTLDTIQVTGGAKLEMLGVDLLTPGLLPGPMRRLRRLRRPCEVYGVAEFTDADLMYSPAIRRLAERVINAALRPRTPSRPPSPSSWSRSDGRRTESAKASVDRGAKNGGARMSNNGSGEELVGGAEEQQRVHVFRVRVHGSKLAVEGEMVNGPFSRVPFRYDISLSVSRNGQLLHLKDPSVYWGTPGGHVPLPMLPQLQIPTIDLGDRARLEHLRISRGRMGIAGRFILSPVSPLTVSRGSKRANIEHDLAESLSRLVCNLFRFKRDNF